MAMPLDQEACYAALCERDPAYEGVLYVGVRTTGVFCRPTCPARPPKRENCEFFADARQAMLASYRPCKRCRPLSHPDQASAVVRLLVEMLAPYKGRIYDPCCGSGGMFVQSVKFLESRDGTAMRDSASLNSEASPREGARAKIRVMVKRILNKYGYPPDLQEEAVKTVLMQAEPRPSRTIVPSASTVAWSPGMDHRRPPIVGNAASVFSGSL